jgi:hypothetical protein
LLLIGCSKEKIDLSSILESDEIIIQASNFKDGIISDKEEIERFHNFVSEISFADISSKKAAEIYRKSEESNSLLVIPTTADNSKEDNHPMLNFYEDGTVLWIEFEEGIGKPLYKAKYKPLYKEMYSYYEKNSVNTLQIQ